MKKGLVKYLVGLALSCVVVLFANLDYSFITSEFPIAVIIAPLTISLIGWTPMFLAVETLGLEFIGWGSAFTLALPELILSTLSMDLAQKLVPAFLQIPTPEALGARFTISVILGLGYLITAGFMYATQSLTCQDGSIRPII